MLPDHEQRLFDKCVALLSDKADANRVALGYYQGEHRTRDLGVSTPRRMRDLDTVAGWPGTVVDTLEERLDFQGWSGDERLPRVFEANRLDTEASLVHLDALVFGVGFAAVTPGGPHEPHPLVTALATTQTTGLWNPRTRALSAALTFTGDDEWTFWTATHTFRRHRHGGDTVETVSAHRLGRVPVVAFRNRPTPSRRDMGRSEITKAVRYYTDAACRTLLGMEINREFYNTPQRIGLNLPEDAFKSADGTEPWVSAMGVVWTMPPNPDGKDAPNPQMIQFDPSSPAPYLDQLRGYQAVLAAEAGIPETYLGLHTSNPASADAIRALESRLVRRVRRRQVTFGQAWREVAALALAVAGRPGPDAVTVEWGNPATQTLASEADAVSKLVGAGILPPASDVTLGMLQLTAAQRAQVRADQADAAASALALEIAALPEPPPNPFAEA